MLNSVVLVGRAGADPEIKYFESGKSKTTFNLAVDRPVKRTEGVDTTDWFRIELWGKSAEIAAEYVKKGKLVGIVGRLEFSRWTDANGQKHELPIISANELRLLGSKSDNAGGGFGGSRGGGGDDYGF
ncbi:Single-stranded DNA-binding protein [compost metagenome]